MQFCPNRGAPLIVYFVYFGLYVAALVYTCIPIYECFSKYNEFSSILTQREIYLGYPGSNFYTFPKITICSYQMHSRYKINEFYPNVNMTVLKGIYGMRTRLSDNVEDWADLNTIDLEEFYQKTMPDLVVDHCLFDTVDCRHILQVKKTKLGNCLVFDLYQEIEDAHFMFI